MDADCSSETLFVLFCFFFCIYQTKFPVILVYTQKNKAGKCLKFSDMLRASPTEKRWKSFISGTNWTKCVSSLQSGSLLQNHLHFWRPKYGRVLNKTQTHWFLLLLPSAPIHRISGSFLLFFQTEWLSHYSFHLVHWAEHCNKFKEITAGQVFTLARHTYMLFTSREVRMERHFTEVLTNCPRQ